MWPILVEFGSASSEIRRRIKKKKESLIKHLVHRHAMSGGLNYICIIQFITCGVMVTLNGVISVLYYCVQRQCTVKASTSRWILATRPKELTLHQTRTASSTCSSVECWRASLWPAVQTWRNLHWFLATSSATTRSPMTPRIRKSSLPSRIGKATQNISSVSRIKWNWTCSRPIRCSNLKKYNGLVSQDKFQPPYWFSSLNLL